MATLAEIAQLEDSKYFPPALKLGAQHRADTVVTPYIDGAAYFRAIADVLDGLNGLDDRLYITSWRLNTSLRLRPTPGEPDLGDRLAQLWSKLVDVRVIVAIPRYSLGNSWGPFTWNPATWSPQILRSSIQLVPVGTAHDNITSVERLRAVAPALSRHVLIDWGGGIDSRHEKCTIAYNSTQGELHAFVGGIDYAIDRVAEERHPGAPQGNYWHDVGVKLQGGAAEDVLANFWTRWDETASLPPRRRFWFLGEQLFNENPAAKSTPLTPPSSPVPIDPPPGSHVDAGVRIWRSYGKKRVTGVLGDLDLPWQTLPSSGVSEVLVGMTVAIRSAQRFIYVEDQTVNPAWPVAELYNHHRALYPVFSAACADGVKVIFVTQGFSPEGLAFDATPNTSEEIWEWIVSDLPPAQQRNFALFYRKDTKVHSKLMIVDDDFVTIGSANLWDRSQEGDENEVNAAIVHPGGSQSLVADLRVRLWREHLNPPGGATDDPKLRDLSISLGYFRETWGTGKRADVPGSTLVEMAP